MQMFGREFYLRYTFQISWYQELFNKQEKEKNPTKDSVSKAYYLYKMYLNCEWNEVKKVNIIEI